MKGCMRYAYADPMGIGWAAWWERLPGEVVAFERLDGSLVMFDVYQDDDAEYSY